MPLWSVLFLFLLQTPGEIVRSEFSKILKNEHLAKAYYQSHAGSKDKIVQGYAAAARCISAGTYYNPYTKYSEFKQGTERLDELILKHPFEPELRYQRLLIQLFSPSFLGYDDHIANDLKSFCSSLAAYQGCSTTYKLEMIRNLEPSIKNASQKLLLQQCKTAIKS